MDTNLYVCVSGTHGIGKSRIVELLCRRNNWLRIPETPDTTVKPIDIGPSAKNPIMGEIWHLRQIIFREKFLRMPGIKVADRSVQDCLVYSRAFEREGKISQETYRMFEDVTRAVSLTDPDLEIMLWADIEKLKGRINGRGRYNLEGWGEDDLTHLKFVNDGFLEYYESFRDLRPLLFLDTTSDAPEDTFDKAMEEIRKLIRLSNGGRNLKLTEARDGQAPDGRAENRGQQQTNL